MKTEEKAEAYDRAIEGIQEILSSGQDSIKMSRLKLRLQGIFPELKESEDEKIRKGIIDFLWKEKIFLQEAHSSVENNPKYRFVMDAIAWLEKQGWKEYPQVYETKDGDNKHICELNNSYSCVKFPFKAKVKSSGKIVTIPGGQLSPDGREWRKYQSDAEDGYKVYEPNNLELVCEIKQKPVALSEEDEKNTNSIIDAIKSVYCTEALDGTYDFEKIFAWLKSLKGRIYWKPSEEQIYWLKWTINRMPDTEKANEAETVLKDLLEYLEKL